MIEQSLRGIRIIDLSMGCAGPLACRQLADMGADAIKVESCERFDWWRSWEATPEWIEDDGAEKSSAFNMVNCNKRAITLDLEDPSGREILLRLVASAHAVVENFYGWFPFCNKNLANQIAEVRSKAEQHGRNPDDIGIEVISPLGEAGPKQLDQLKRLRDIGVSHAAVATMNVGLKQDEHIDAIKRFWDAAHTMM